MATKPLRDTDLVEDNYENQGIYRASKFDKNDTREYSKYDLGKDNLVSLRRGANDNRDPKSQIVESYPRERRSSLVPQIRKKKELKDNKKIDLKGIKEQNRASTIEIMVWLLWYTGWLYMTQVFFAFFGVVGIAVGVFGSTFFFGILDFFGITSNASYILLLFSMMATTACGLIQLMLVLGFLDFRYKMTITKGLSIPLMGLAFALVVAPLTSLFPTVQLWAWYVVRANKQSKKI